MGKRERLDTLLVQRELVSSREEGRRRILAAEVLVNEQPLTKAGALVDETAELRLKVTSAYVSRGGLKLEKALRQFHIDVKDKVALDVGASTGGFTHCLLAHGVRQVYAVDCGYGQLDWKLRNDARVVVLERRNVRYLEASDLPQLADFATIDVSFISLRLVLPKVKSLLSSGGEIIALIKPQFEVGKGKVGKGGVVRSSAEHERVIEEINKAAIGLGLTTQEVTESPLLGAKGNKEFLIHLTDPDSRS
ncbi:MAG TPA: TlyA family RNA methyltransferase [Candidatus Polarisedimenticolaceae bacterium]|nr:TlyA family RNA methyltransferase [Candidatus Polarisedimenticolaceae bacterium]